jgi:hypothetical protein
MLCAIDKRQLGVLARRCACQQIETLKHEAELAIANLCELIAIEVRNVGIIQKIVTGTRPIKATKDVHER